MPHQDAQPPTLLPILSWGKHRDPRKGACFMEFASLTGDDLHIEARIALGSAIMALPVVTAKRQPLMAVSVLSCDRVLAELDGRPVGALEAPSRAALAQAPRAARYASRLVGGPRGEAHLGERLPQDGRAGPRPHRRRRHRAVRCAGPRRDAARPSRPGDRRVHDVG